MGDERTYEFTEEGAKKFLELLKQPNPRRDATMWRVRCNRMMTIEPLEIGCDQVGPYFHQSKTECGCVSWILERDPFMDRYYFMVHAVGFYDPKEMRYDDLFYRVYTWDDYLKFCGGRRFLESIFQFPMSEEFPEFLQVVEDKARWLHDNYNRFAIEEGWKVQNGTDGSWDALPYRNKRVMLRLAKMLHEIEIDNILHR